MVEQHGIEGGELFQAIPDDGKISQKSVNERLKAVDVDDDERTALNKVKKLLKDEAAAKKVAKEVEAALTAATIKKYSELTEDEIRTLVVDDKWLTDIAELIENEIEARADALISRLRVLVERYADTLPSLSDLMRDYDQRISAHLHTMGYEW